MRRLLSDDWKLVAKEDVRKALKSVDPDGVNKRKSKTIVRREYLSSGPGSIYHIDGNDKLKRWGFCIHGFVDGFSRKLLWLVVASSINDPIVISNYFLRCTKKYGIAPNLLRMDKGRENIYCEDLQLFFTIREDSYLYAASTRNQSIKAYWSKLKKFRLSWWIDFFSGMVYNGMFRPNLETLRMFAVLPLTHNAKGTEQI